MVTYEYMSRNMRIYATSAHGVNITETQMSYFKVGSEAIPTANSLRHRVYFLYITMMWF